MISNFDPFPTMQNHDAHPRRCKDADEVETVEGTGIRYAVVLPIQSQRQTAALKAVDWGSGYCRLWTGQANMLVMAFTGRMIRKYIQVRPGGFR